MDFDKDLPHAMSGSVANVLGIRLAYVSMQLSRLAVTKTCFSANQSPREQICQ